MSSIYDYLKVGLDALKPVDKYQITYPTGRGYPHKPQVEEKKGGDGIVNVDTFKDCTGKICNNLEGWFYRKLDLVQAVRFEFDDAAKSIRQITKSLSGKASNETEADFLLSVFDKLDGDKEALPSNRVACISYPEKGRDYQIHLSRAKAELDKKKGSLKQYLLGELDNLSLSQDKRYRRPY